MLQGHPLLINVQWLQRQQDLIKKQERIDLHMQNLEHLQAVLIIVRLIDLRALQWEHRLEHKHKHQTHIQDPIPHLGVQAHIQGLAQPLGVHQVIQILPEVVQVIAEVQLHQGVAQVIAEVQPHQGVAHHTADHLHLVHEVHPGDHLQVQEKDNHYISTQQRGLILIWSPFYFLN